MFTFNIIKFSQAQGNFYHKNFWERIKKFSHSLSEPLSKETYFIIGEEEKKIALGAASLHKIEIKNVQEDLRELITTSVFQRGYVWECSSVFLEFFSSSPTHLEKTSLSRIFFQELYEVLVHFLIQQGENFIVMRLPPQAYTSSRDFGRWPYVVELKPEHSPDGNFYGILPLTGSQYELYQGIKAASASS
jgi:hypothetical protein